MLWQCLMSEDPIKYRIPRTRRNGSSSWRHLGVSVVVAHRDDMTAANHSRYHVDARIQRHLDTSGVNLGLDDARLPHESRDVACSHREL